MIIAHAVLARNYNQAILQELSQLRKEVSQDRAVRESDASSE